MRVFDKKVLQALTMFSVLICSPVYAVKQSSGATAISTVNVNGGTDTTEPASTGTNSTCIVLSAAVSSACPSGLIAIINNNRALIAGALWAKTLGTTSANVFYDDTAPSSGPIFCPNYNVSTPCTLISIQF